MAQFVVEPLVNDFESVEFNQRTVVDHVVTISPTTLVEPSLVESVPLRAAPVSRLSEFVIGPENATARVALQALIEVVRESGRRDVSAAERLAQFDRFNPLVLCGPTGSGKSLFVHTLIRAWQAAEPTAKFELTTGSDFARSFAAAIDERRIVAWRKALRAADLLVIDDFTYFSGRNAPQVELLHALDELIDRGTMVIGLTRTPLAECREWLLPQVSSRLAGGLQIELRLPELETRYEIVRRFAEQRGVTIAPAALRALAQGVRGGAAELFSAVMTLESRANATAKKIDLALTKEFVAQTEALKAPSLRTIALYAARHFGVTLADLKSPSRRQTIVKARDLAMVLGRRLTGKSFEQLGRYFGGRDHTTVLHGCRKLEAQLEHDAELRQVADQLMAEVVAQHA